jgi:hypothetical protein
MKWVCKIDVACREYKVEKKKEKIVDPRPEKGRT